MAINFFSLEKSEIELKQTFNEFLRLCFKIHEKAKEILKSKTINDEAIAEMHEYKIKAKEKKRDVRDDCIWILSKDQPRANHLRYIIAVLYSVRDLERIAEQGYNIIWYSKNSNLSESLMTTIYDVLDFSNDIFKSMKKIIEEKDVTKHTETVKKLANEFKENYKESLSDALKNSISLDTNKEFDYIYTFSIIMKYIDRTMDHLWSIYENFSMIKNND